LAKRQPQRTCVGCQQVMNKRDLVRVVRTPDGSVVGDTTGKAHGRGAYLCNQRACWQRALERGSIGRALKTRLSDEDRVRIETYLAALDAPANGET